ncbi:methylthioribose kinase [Priestia megaterium]|nr:methylthioribose kinase [Priestia megaterium]
MIQRFIELGQGYSDIYELFEIAKNNKSRLVHLIMLRTNIENRPTASFVVILHPTSEGNFQPLYICREGITLLENKDSKRVKLFSEVAESLQKEILTLDVKPSTMFPETALYYQHLIGILRMNHYIPPMQ